MIFTEEDYSLGAYAESERELEALSRTLSGPANRLKHLVTKPSEKGLFSTVQEAGKFLARRWEALEARYGRRGALAMAVAMIGTAPLPGNIAAVIAVAEGIRGLQGYFQREYDGEVEKLVKGETVMDVAPQYQLRFPVDRLKKFVTW